MQRQQNDGVSLRGGVNILYLLASAHATCFTVFTRHSFGVDALGINGLAALGLMIVYMCFAHCPPMLVFIGIWLVALVLQRIKTLVMVRMGQFEHSRCDGYPWLGFMIPFVRRVDTAKFCEAMLCFALGPFLCGIDEPLGQFVWFGSVSLLVKACIEGEIEKRQVQRMRDAEIEMRQMVDRFHGRDF